MSQNVVCVTMVLCVGLIEALRVNEPQPIQARVHRSRAVGLIRHQSVVAITHPAIHLQTQRNVNQDTWRLGGFLFITRSNYDVYVEKITNKTSFKQAQYHNIIFFVNHFNYTTPITSVVTVTLFCHVSLCDSNIYARMSTFTKKTLHL